MEFWGIDRSKVSLRLRSLERLGEIDNCFSSDDKLNRVVGALASHQSLEAGKLPMKSSEYEILIALASSTKYLKDEKQKSVLIQQLSTYLLEMPTTKFNASPTINNTLPSPWHVASCTIVKALLDLGAPSAVYSEFTERIEQLWNSRLSNESLVPWAFSLRGFLEGVSDSENVNFEALVNIYHWTKRFLNHGFMSSLFSALAIAESYFTKEVLPPQLESLRRVKNNHLAFPGPTQLTMTISQLVRAVARANLGTPENSLTMLLKTKPFSPSGPEAPKLRDEQLMVDLGQYSLEEVNILESSFQFRLAESPQLVPISARTMWYYFEVLGVVEFYNIGNREAIFGYVMTAMESDQVDTREDAILNISRLAIMCCHDDETTLSLWIRALPVYLGAVSADTAEKIGCLLVSGLMSKSQSLLVSTIYALANALNLDEYMIRKRQYELSTHSGNTKDTLANESEANFARFASNVLITVIYMVITYDDSQVHALVLTILSQKYGSVSVSFDLEIIKAYAILAPHLSERDFNTVNEQLCRGERDAFEKGKENVVIAIETTRSSIAADLAAKDPHSPIFWAYLDHLLGLIVDKGDQQNDMANSYLKGHESLDLSPEAIEVSYLFKPLAALLPRNAEPPLACKDWSIATKFRDAWLNLAVLGYSRHTKWNDIQKSYLEIIARSSPPLVLETSANKVQSDLELNPVLRRSTSDDFSQKRIGRSIKRKVKLPTSPKATFLTASTLLEHFRCHAGIISPTLYYFGDPEFRDSEGVREMNKILVDVATVYTNLAVAKRELPQFNLPQIAQQLKEIFTLCCHRIETIREAALETADTIINRIPSALCHKTSLYALLDLLTLMWQSCVDAEVDEYDPRTSFESKRSKVRIEPNNSFETRRHALKRLLQSARKWSAVVLPLMAEDIKSILTFYLDDMETEEGASDTFDNVALGRSFALQMGGTVRDMDSVLGGTSRGATGVGPNNPDSLADGVSGFLGQYLNLSEYRTRSTLGTNDQLRQELRRDFIRLNTAPKPRPEDLSAKELRGLYSRAAQFVSSSTPMALFVSKSAVHVPFRYFNGQNIKVGIKFWIWMINQTPELRASIMREVSDHWSRSIDRKLGLFSRKLDNLDPFFAEMTYTPTEKKGIDHEIKLVNQQFEPHLYLVQFLKSGFHATVFLEGVEYLDLYVRVVTDALNGLIHYASLHPLARTLRLELIKLSLEILVPYNQRRPRESLKLRNLIVKAALSWYKQPPQWAFGGNLVQLRSDMALLKDLSSRLRRLFTNISQDVSLLLFFVEEELNRLEVWYDPLGKTGSGKFVVDKSLIQTAAAIDLELGIYLLERNYAGDAERALTKYVLEQPLKVCHVPRALKYYLNASGLERRRFILYWASVSPIESVNLFLVGPRYSSDSFLLQYTMRSLESHPITTCFFYVPQIVQALRHDEGGYVEEYILEAGKFSQLFAHQIIWNILANSYKDDEMEVPDDMKPTLDRIISLMIDSFSPDEREFYDREFGFFNEVTSISGSLKPYIKKSKAEKKEKIDQEMNKVVLPEGVYLPSHPLGTIVEIDRESGRPLQSHAKAPFLAKFKVKCEEKEYKGTESHTKSVETWQGAIFKVGDDCRQDVLVLQIIAAFKNIFDSTGLDCFVYPNKVTATAPGCGVIDVLPNSISRDMLGREAVNGLYEWFISKYGSEDSIEFQRARNNFIKSMAAYSVISYLLQFKDRHNGNIMYDDDGHIIHIDFGFCFDIVPGGVKFEAAPFKLTKEMVAVMGGSPRTEAYHWFEELCIKAFLACRLYAEEIIAMVIPMLESGLPCFKEHTIRNLRNRFALNKSEREAANHMRSLINKSYESNFTKVYDEFQRITNGIPY